MKVLARMGRATQITLLISAWFALVLPLWYYTIRTYRAPLDYGAMDMFNTNVDSLMTVKVPVFLECDDSKLPDIVPAVQVVVDRQLEQRGVRNWAVSVKEGHHPSALTVRIKEGEENLYFIPGTGRELGLSYNWQLLTAGQVPDMVVDFLLDHVLGPELEWFTGKQALPNHVMGYTPKYHVTFSLFYGDGDIISWNLTGALHRFEPLRNALSYAVANITIDSQVEYYADMGCDPHWDQEKHAWVLEKSDLATFVNFAEWSLASTFDYPAINFVLYVPSTRHTPLQIADSTSNSFLIPQWGGVVVLNTLDLNGQTRQVSKDDLDRAMDIFASQLLSLLGAPELPRSPQIRVDTLSRMAASRAIHDTAASLGSLHRLAKNMPNIAIPNQVLENCEAALKNLKESISTLDQGFCAGAVHKAGEALTFAEKAFFDKHMVAQTFFPDEHKLAVYMPLLGPIGVVLLGGWLQIRRRNKADARTKKLIEDADAVAQASKACQVEKTKTD